MATHVKTFAFAIIMISSQIIASPSPSSEKNDIDTALDEMERANYFTFVMLLNMVQPNMFQGNVTFLMPSDRSLSRSMILQNNVEDLLLRHSIPSPLLFDHLLHLPTNSVLPTSNPDLMLKVSNSGRRGLFLGNVRIVTPNICTHGLSVRCHGVDGVVSMDIQKPGLPSSITCSSIAYPAAAPLFAPPGLSPATPHYGTSGGGRPQLKLSLTCITFVWILHSKALRLV